MAATHGATDAPITSSIAQSIAALVHGPEASPGDALPSERELARRFGVARNTIRSALARLADAGIIQSRPGHGWLVTPTAPAQSFDRLRSFAQWALANGRRPGGRVLSQRDVRPTQQEAKQLGCPHEDTVLEVVRLRTLDGRPVMLERTHYAPWVRPAVLGLKRNVPSVVRALEIGYGIVSEDADQHIDAVPATSEDAAALGVPRSSPLLRVQRISYTADHRPIERGDDRYISRFMSLRVHSSRSHALSDLSLTAPSVGDGTWTPTRRGTRRNSPA